MKKSKFDIIPEYITYLFFLLFIFSLRSLGIDRSSNISRKIFELLGPLSSTDKIVRNNIKYIYENISDDSLKKLSKEIWGNFGRYVGEFPFINENFLKNNPQRVIIEGKNNITKLTQEGKSFVMFSAHLANWDFILFYLLNEVKKPSIVYRKINNRFIESYVKKTRNINNVHMIKKGLDAGRELIKAVKNNNNILMLVDQKLNEGIDVPFMGRSAKTTESVGVLARQYDYAVVPVRIIRENSANFRIIIDEALYSEKTDNKKHDIYNLTLRVNNIISSWIKENPSQWFWMHQRWGKKHEMK